MKNSIRIKVCCISSAEEAHQALQAGADALGFVSAMPSGPGILDEATIRSIVDLLPTGTESVLLTSRRELLGILEQAFRCRTSTIQLCDTLEGTTYAELRAALPGNHLIQVVHVTGEEAIEVARAAAPGVEALLLDTGSQDGSARELGGTGRTHDWSISARIRESVPTNVYLAGGLNAGNVEEAIRTVRPYGVDLCTGARTDGKLDPAKVRAFVKAARNAAAALS